MKISYTTLITLTISVFNFASANKNYLPEFVHFGKLWKLNNSYIIPHAHDVLLDHVKEIPIEEQGCPKILTSTPVELGTLIGNWHLAYMSKHWARYMAKHSHAKFTEQSSTGALCIKTSIQRIEPVNGSNATLSMRSKCPRTGAEKTLLCASHASDNSRWLCSDKLNKDDSSFFYIVDTDNKSWALVIRCFPGNGLNWAIFSKAKQLDRHVVKSLLAQLEGYGFKLFNVREVPYQKCI